MSDDYERQRDEWRAAYSVAAARVQSLELTIGQMGLLAGLPLPPDVVAVVVAARLVAADPCEGHVSQLREALAAVKDAKA